VASARPLGNALGDIGNALGRAHRSAAVFMNDEHGKKSEKVDGKSNFSTKTQENR
jgi:hypothetical protein